MRDLHRDDEPVKAASKRATARVGKAHRIRALLVAAFELFVERGIDATRIDAITDRAGVSKGVLYLYFDGKESLLVGLVAEHFFCRFPCVDADWQGLQPTEQLASVAEAWRQALTSGPLGGLARLVFTESHRHPSLSVLWEEQAVRPTLIAVRQALQAGVSAGQFRDVDPTLVTHTLVNGVLMAWLIAPDGARPNSPLVDALTPEGVSRQVATVLRGCLNQESGDFRAEGSVVPTCSERTLGRCRLGSRRGPVD